MAHALSLGLDWPLTIDAPYANTEKAEVIRRGAALGVPFELTLSCMNPPPQSLIPNPQSLVPNPQSLVAAIHCGLCSKCRERHDAFVEAAVQDPTTYANTVNLR